jgi:hypothetical protein
VPESDQTVENALIAALKTDDNIAVRSQALEALKAHSFDEKIQSAVIYVLQHDHNVNLRLQAINFLQDQIDTGNRLEEEVVNQLKQRVRNDSNDLVRLRARSALLDANYSYF